LPRTPVFTGAGLIWGWGWRKGLIDRKKGKSRTTILEREGWTKQFLACEPRLTEAVEMYKEAGFEVHLEPLPKEPECEACTGDEDEDECRICFEGFEDQYKIIFTRRKGGKAESEDELI
jgi:hypothetical protein